MALGSVTVVRGGSFAFANKRMKTVSVQLSSGANYTTGGETLTAASVGLKKIEAVIPLGNATTTSGTTSRTVVVLMSDPNVKLLVQTTASAEAASNSDQSTFTQRLLVMGF